jgi:hypothetical protein
VLDLLAAGEAALLNARLAIAPGARFVDERNTPDRRVAPRITVHFDRRNPAIDRELDEDSLALLDIAAGGGTVTEVIGEFAALCETSFDEVKGQVLSFVRDSLVRGLVVLRDVE